MFSRRTICTTIVATGIASYSLVATATATPNPKAQTKRSVLRLGTQPAGASLRGGGFTMCNGVNDLVSENFDMVTITQGNSINCFGGTGTPGHSYGRSHDLSLSHPGEALELSCIHFGMASNSVATTVTVNVYIDQDGTAGPLPDGSDLWQIGSIQHPVAVSTVPTYEIADAVTPFPLNPDALLFIEFVFPETFPGTHEIGSNSAGEASPSWLKTTNGDCGIGTWVNPSVLGFPNMAILEAIEVGVAILPDPCNDPLPNCASDIDGSGAVTVDDLLAVIGAWGQCGDGTFRPAGDVAPLPNGDCCIDVNDVLQLISDFGLECDPGGGVDGLGINEIRIDQAGADNDEYVELIGPAGTSLDGYSYIVIGDGTGVLGVLETVIDLTGLVIPDDGLLSIGSSAMTIGVPDVINDTFNFENSNTVTHLLVQGLTALLGDDLDVEDDGVLDGTYWASEADSVGLQDADSDGTPNGLLYTDTVVGPNGIYPPAHIFRCPDAGDWMMGSYDSLAMDTPGNPNSCDGTDLDGDGVFDLVDNCYLYNPDQADCNNNDIGDVCDIADGVSQDCNGNGIPDECEADCNGNGIPDECDIANGEVDCDGNGIPDSCEADCNANGVSDTCDIADGTSSDDNANGVPDECEEGNLLYTSFEEPLIGGQYVDLGDAAVDHALLNNAGEAMVEWVASGAEMGFTAFYYNTRGSVGLTDGDYVGVTNYTGGGVGGYPDGAQGYQMSDCDGMMEITLDTATASGSWNVSLDMFVASTGWEADDLIIVDIIVDGGAVLTLLDTTGQDIDNLGIEGAWFNWLQDLTGYTEATLRVSLDSNSGSEAIFIDNVVFSSNAIQDTDGDGVPDSQDNCYLPNPDQLDCNGNGSGDVCDLADGVSFDCDFNSVPDECDPDCNTNGIPDACDIADGTSQDADGNGIPDECEVVNGFLIITGVYDAQLVAGAGPKGVELYVVSDIADLSLYGIGGANNGGGSDGEEFTFPAVGATAGSYIYVTNTDAGFLSFFGFAADYVSGAMSINGNDAIELFENGNVIDTFGDINLDGTGTPWDYFDGWAKRASGSGPDGVVFDIASWTFSGINTLEGDTNDTCIAPFVLGGFAP